MTAWYKCDKENVYTYTTSSLLGLFTIRMFFTMSGSYIYAYICTVAAELQVKFCMFMILHCVFLSKTSTKRLLLAR